MAEYHGDPRGHSSNYQRDAAFSNIFGAAPPPGRSQTMTSSSMPPQMMPQQGRTQTMSSSTMSSMQRQPPPRVPPGQYMDREPSSPRGAPVQHNGYAAQQRSASGGYQVPNPQAHYLQQQQQQARRPYGGPAGPLPPRGDARGPPPSSQAQYGPPRTAAQRYYQAGGGAGPALNNDPYRSQSLASAPRPNMYQPPRAPTVLNRVTKPRPMLSVNLRTIRVRPEPRRKEESCRSATTTGPYDERPGHSEQTGARGVASHQWQLWGRLYTSPRVSDEDDKHSFLEWRFARPKDNVDGVYGGTNDNTFGKRRCDTGT
ncbi:CNH domain-containing protein [Colletotrichum higginsianum]|nr:CNH domain-containing protein [Colletotrichum higginsianum]